MVLHVSFYIYKVPLYEILIPGDLREVDEPLVRGGVMPTWALMPLLQEPVWDMGKAVFWPTSSTWHEEEGDEDFHLQEGSIPGSISSSTFFRSSAPAQLLPSCSVWLCVSLFDCESHRHTKYSANTVISHWQSVWQMAKLFLLAKAKCPKLSVCSICCGLLTDCWYKAIYKNVCVRRKIHKTRAYAHLCCFALARWDAGICGWIQIVSADVI